MIQRINLIEKEPFRFTYEKLFFAGAAVIFLCASLFAVQILRVKANAKKTDLLSAQINTLKLEREKLLKKSDSQWQGGPLFELKKVFDQTPAWGKVLTDLSHRLPGTVWLTGFKSFKREGMAAGKGLVLNGIARDPADLTVFLSHLTESPFVSRAVLSSSKKESAGFTFAMECDIAVSR